MISENCLRSTTNMFAVVFDEQVKQLRELLQLRERKQIWLRPDA